MPAHGKSVVASVTSKFSTDSTVLNPTSTATGAGVADDDGMLSDPASSDSEAEHPGEVQLESAHVRNTGGTTGADIRSWQRSHSSEQDAKLTLAAFLALLAAQNGNAQGYPPSQDTSSSTTPNVTTRPPPLSQPLQAALDTLMWSTMPQVPVLCTSLPRVPDLPNLHTSNSDAATVTAAAIANLPCAIASINSFNPDNQAPDTSISSPAAPHLSSCNSGRSRSGHPGPQNSSISSSRVIHLNVGGTRMSTLRSTLCLIPDSLLGHMFAERWEDTLLRDELGHVFMDHDPSIFLLLLNWLRVQSLGGPSAPLQDLQVPAGQEQYLLLLVDYLQLSRYVPLRYPETFNSQLHSQQAHVDGSTVVRIDSRNKGAFAIAVSTTAHFDVLLEVLLEVKCFGAVAAGETCMESPPSMVDNLPMFIGVATQQHAESYAYSYGRKDDVAFLKGSSVHGWTSMRQAAYKVVGGRRSQLRNIPVWQHGDTLQLTLDCRKGGDTAPMSSLAGVCQPPTSPQRKTRNKARRAQVTPPAYEPPRSPPPLQRGNFLGRQLQQLLVQLRQPQEAPVLDWDYVEPTMAAALAAAGQPIIPAATTASTATAAGGTDVGTTSPLPLAAGAATGPTSTCMPRPVTLLHLKNTRTLEEWTLEVHPELLHDAEKWVVVVALCARNDEVRINTSRRIGQRPPLA